eukprot:317112_1
MSKGGGSLVGAIIGGIVLGVAEAAVNSAVDSSSKAISKGCNPRPKKTLNVKCRCGANMSLNRVKHIYNSDSCVCDLCNKYVCNYRWIYHCTDNNNAFHPKGYNLCLKCSEGIYIHQQKADKIENQKYIQNELIAMGFNNADIQQILPKLDKSDKNKAVHEAVKLLGNKPINSSVSVMNDSEVKTILSETKSEHEQEGVPDITSDYVEPSAPTIDEIETDIKTQTETKIDDSETVLETRLDKVNKLIHMKGWMMKSGAQMCIFSARYFELRTNKKLKYYKAKPVYENGYYIMSAKNYICGTVNFEKTKITKMRKLTNNKFHVVTKERTWKFSCNSEIERNEWYDAIKLICAKSK